MAATVAQDGVLANPAAEGETEKVSLGNVVIVPYENERQLKLLTPLIEKDLSEPYSVYTYRYFIHNWPQLCFLVRLPPSSKCLPPSVFAYVCLCVPPLHSPATHSWPSLAGHGRQHMRWDNRL